MKRILDLQKQCDELSSLICSFCKPLMLSVEFRAQVRQLLSSEADLRLTIELAMEVSTSKEMKEKTTLAKEEAEIILYTLLQMDDSKTKELKPMKELTKTIIKEIEFL